MTAASTYKIARAVESLALQVSILLQNFAQVDDNARLVALMEGKGKRTAHNENLQHVRKSSFAVCL